MLQVISKKFFKTDNYHRTEVKTIVYSNIMMFDKLETDIVTLEPIETYDGITSYLLTFVNVIEVQNTPNGQLVSIGKKEIIEDLLACFSFYFNGIFESDKNFIENLLRDKQKNASDIDIPKVLLPNIFKKGIHITSDKFSGFNEFINNLILLPNKKYMKVISSIKQIKHAIITINYNLELAYTMFVASIESLATKFDGYNTVWEDCFIKSNRRKALDNILDTIDSSNSEKIKNIIIEDTHAKLGMRYRMFILKYISDEYYEEEVGEEIVKCKESLLEKAIKNSYQLRSSYIHALENMPEIIKHSRNSEICDTEQGYFFTFNGISRITKFVIKKFIYAEEKVEKEDINYFDELPGSIRVSLASQYWIWKAEDYSIEKSKIYYQGLLEYISKAEYKKDGFIPLNEVCEKIEKLIKGENNESKKILLVDFYALYNLLLKDEFRCVNYKKFFEKYDYLIDKPYIENAMVALILNQNLLPWDTETLSHMYKKYDENRFHKDTIKIPNKLEICFLLELANRAFNDKNMDLMKTCVIKAFKEKASDKFVENIYHKLKDNNVFENIKWYEYYFG